MIFKKHRRLIIIVSALIVSVLVCVFIFLRLILSGKISTPQCSLMAMFYQKGSYSGLPGPKPTATNYVWENESLKKEFLSANWHNITAGVLNIGIRIGAGWSEDYSCVCSRDSDWLREEGGMRHTCFYLSERAGMGLYMRSSGLEIRTLEAFKKKLAPVDTEGKAAAFVALNQGGLARKDYKLVGNTATITNGYFVQAIALNTFGCGDHREQKVIFWVTRNGNIEKAAWEKLPGPTGPQVVGVCVD